MIITAKNGKAVELRRLDSSDLDGLLEYLSQLSENTRRRFGPHPFDRQSVIDFYDNPALHWGFVAQDVESGAIVAYSIIRPGYLDHDGRRLQSYGWWPDAESDCTYAPSVADDWQSMGVGNGLWQFILAALKEKGLRRVILWGGVQSGNEKAVNFYRKNGFRMLGCFEHNGWNDDMVLELT